MARTTTALLAILGLLSLAVPATASETGISATAVSALADSKTMTLDLLDARLSYAVDKGDNDLRLALLKGAMDQMGDAESDDVKALRAQAARPGAVVPADVRAAIARLDKVDAAMDGFVARLVTADRPIALPAEAVDSDVSAPTIVAGPMPVAVTVEMAAR